LADRTPAAFEPAAADRPVYRAGKFPLYCATWEHRQRATVLIKKIDRARSRATIMPVRIVGYCPVAMADNPC